jgi:hypothetical protein
MNVIQLSPKSEEFNRVNSLLTFNVLYIDKVICHPKMEEDFIKLKEKIPNCEIKQLFHGTTEKNIKNILDEGFDLNRCKSCFYGKGIYFAIDDKYSRGYSKNTLDQQVSYMFLCDVLVGRCKRGERNEILDINLYDNFVNDVSYPTIYVTTYVDGILPRYVIAFKK